MPTEVGETPFSSALDAGATATLEVPGAELDASSCAAEVQRLLKLPVAVSAILAARDLEVRSILAITVGSIIEFDVPCNADLSLNVSNKPIGSGQAIKIGENFGVRLTSIGTVQERIDAMGPQT